MYAKDTKVSVKQTRHDIESVLAKYGADRFGFTVEPGRAIVMFQLKNRTIRFTLPLPEGAGPKVEQLQRSRWRALLLCIKAKLESAASKIETFDEAFLAQIVTDDGATVYETMRPKLAALPPPDKPRIEERP